MKIFDQPRHPAVDYASLLRPGQVSIVDLSGTDSPMINNIVIADMLRSIQRAQDAAYQSWERAGRARPAAQGAGHHRRGA